MITQCIFRFEPPTAPSYLGAPFFLGGGGLLGAVKVLCVKGFEP